MYRALLWGLLHMHYQYIYCLQHTTLNSFVNFREGRGGKGRGETIVPRDKTLVARKKQHIKHNRNKPQNSEGTMAKPSLRADGIIEAYITCSLVVLPMPTRPTWKKVRPNTGTAAKQHITITIILAASRIINCVLIGLLPQGGGEGNNNTWCQDQLGTISIALKICPSALPSSVLYLPNVQNT